MCGSVSRVVFSPEINNPHLRFCSFTCPLVVLVSPFIKALQWLPGGLGMQSKLLGRSGQKPSLTWLLPPRRASASSSSLCTSALSHPTAPSAFQFLKQTLQTLERNSGSTPCPLAAQTSSFHLDSSALRSAQISLPSRKPSLTSQI